MDKYIAKQAKDLLNKLEQLQEIKSVIEKEERHWWSFLTPDVQTLDKDGLIMPEILREEFVEAVNRSI